jgi:hypothetical protein
MNVDDIYKLILYICSKNAYQGYISYQDFNSVINQSQISYLDYLLGSLQQYQYNHPQPKVALGLNGEVRQRLAPFLIKDTLSLTSGYVDYPNDYQMVDSMMTNDFKAIRYTQQNYLGSVYNSVIDPISEYPIYLMEQNGFQFYPDTLDEAVITYVGTPNEIVWAYELDSNGRAVYTTGIQGVNVINGGSGYTSATVTFSAPASGGIQATGTVTISSGVVTGIVMTENGTGYNNITPTVTFNGVGGTGCQLGTPISSQDCRFYDVDKLNIISRALRMIGVSLEDNAVSQYAEQIKMVGQ